MTGQPTRSLSPDADRVRERIDEWRRTRAKRTRMPEELWRAATELAREHGAWATARALGVRYDTLSLRVKESGAAASAVGTGFVELPSLPRESASTQATVIELSRADGARLTLRLGDQSTIEVQPLIDAFCRAQR